MSDVITNIDSKTWRTARHALEKAMALYLDDPNVSHIDLGYRIRTSKENQLEPELVVRVHVHQKLTGAEFEKFAALHPDRVIDAQKIGFPVDVIQASYSLQHSKTAADIAMERQGGIAIADKFGKRYGTLGGKVRDIESGEEMMLGTWHLLAATRNPESELYLQQSENGVGMAEQKLLAKYCRNALSASLDAAVAKFDEAIFVTSQPPGIKSIVGSAIPQLGQKTIKSGAGTGITKGIITGILGYSIHQINGEVYIIGPTFHVSSESGEQKISDFGDSGAWWLEPDSLRAVGLHFAGDENSRFALALSMPEVLQALRVEIVPSQPVDCCSLNSSGHLSEITEGQELTNAIMADMTSLSNFIVAFWMKAQLAIGQLTIKLKVLDKKSLDQKLAVYFFYKLIKAIIKNKIIRLYCKLAQACLILFLSLMILQFRYYQPKIDRQQQKQLNNLQRELVLIQLISQMEWERVNQLKKIINVIDYYNQDMDYGLKLKIANEIYQMTKKYSNLEIELICATITHESALTWDPEIVSPANAIGLMQIMPKTGRLLAKEEEIKFNNIEPILFDPISNIRLGCRFLSRLIAAYNIDGGLAAYNGGMKRAETWLQNGRAKGILHEETDKYVPSILKIYKEFRQARNPIINRNVNFYHKFKRY